MLLNTHTYTHIQGTTRRFIIYVMLLLCFFMLFNTWAHTHIHTCTYTHTYKTHTHIQDTHPGCHLRYASSLFLILLNTHAHTHTHKHKTHTHTRHTQTHIQDTHPDLSSTLWGFFFASFALEHAYTTHIYTHSRHIHIQDNTSICHLCYDAFSLPLSPLNSLACLLLRLWIASLHLHHCLCADARCFCLCM